MGPARVQDSVKFGDDFALDLGTGQLSEAGRVLKLERIPTELLLLLVERRGQLVPREQIIERIWGKEVFLDTDNGINAAVRKIRQVLKDDAEQSRFVQTITGRGYRFVAPVIEAEPEPEPFIQAPESIAAEDSAELRSNRRVLGMSILVASILTAAIVLIVALVLYRKWAEPVAQSSPAASASRAMLAVLPFENLTGDSGQEYFSDGMTEEMIAQLGSLDPDHIGVIARTSVMHYKHNQEPLPQIAHELGVQYVLEGSVRRDAEKIRITAQLIQMKDQTHLWAKQYDRDTRDLLVVQSEIAKDISGRIEAALGEHQPLTPLGQPVAQPTLSPEAYEAYNLYLKGQYFWRKRNVQSFQQALSYFQQAIDKDPSYARAYAGLADTYALLGVYRGSPAPEYATKARAAALQAVQLDGNLPEAHAALALIVQNYDYDWQTSEKEFRRAIELNPNYATAHHWYAEHLAWQGRFDEAFRESERARQLDPLSLIIAADNGAILYYSRQYDRAIAQFKAVRELDPAFARSEIIFAVHVEKGMFAEAEVDVGDPADESPWSLSNFAYIYGRAGQAAKAEQKLTKLLDLNRRQPLDPMLIALAYAGMGNQAQAIARLNEAYAQHSNGLTALKVDPAYDSLRGDPQFQKLLQQVGLGQ